MSAPTSPMKRVIEVEGEPEAKRLCLEEVEVSPTETETTNATNEVIPILKKQLEYYFSDMNLKSDKFFHSAISSSENGWLDLSTIMACRKVEALNITSKEIKEACAASTEIEANEDVTALRRKDNKELPKFEGAARQQNNKPKKTGHEGGVMFKVSEIPEEMNWGEIKGAMRGVLVAAGHKDAHIMYCSTKKEGNYVHMCAASFDNDIEYFENLKTLEVGEAKLSVTVLWANELTDALSNVPKEILDKRSKIAMKRTKILSQKCLKIENFTFKNVQEIKKKVREIQTTRSDGEELKNGSGDYNLILALFKYHPKYATKSENMKGLKVDISGYGDSRCFFVIKNDDTCEDFSMVKIFEKIQNNMPYAK